MSQSLDHSLIRRGLAALSSSLIVAASSAALAQSPPPPAQPPAPMCAKDNDCKGARVCNAGQCVEPSGPAAAPPAGGPPPPYAPPNGPPPAGAKGSYYDYKVQVAQDPRLIKDWEEGDPIPEGYIKTTRMRKGLVGGGAGLLGGLWLVSVITGAAIWETEKVCIDLSVNNSGCGDVTHRHWGLFIPVIGPFIDIGTTQTRNAPGVVFDVIDGLGQAGGLAMLIAGLAAPKTVLVRAAGIEMTPMPLVGKGQTGLGLVGSF